MSMQRWLAKAAQAVVLAAVAAASTVAGAQALEKVRFGFAQNAMSPILINFVVPAYLGYFKEEGLDPEFVTLGTNAAVMASLDQKRIEFGVGVPSYQLPLAAKGEKLPGINFYEYTYPFKWAVAVKPDSPIKSLADLKGKTVGVSSLGVTDFPVGKALMRLANVDPEKDVQWLAVGEGVTAGQAIQRGSVDALVYFDTGFGQIEAAGMKLRYLPLPANLPKVGGLYVSASKETLEKKRKQAVGFARAIAKGSLFIQENPEAAAYAFIQMYPEAAPRGAALADQIKSVSVPVTKRMPLFTHYDKSITDWGRISAAEWGDEIEFLGLKDKIKDPTVYFTNDLIPEINNFDRQKVIRQAKEFKIPAK
ncbi:MAG: ABC transporter substrate-binding protein [Burkholderiales bacterium]